MTTITLRDVTQADLPIFFQQQLDPEANAMAAFTARHPGDRRAFREHWARVLADRCITVRTVLADGKVAGYVLTHSWFGNPEVSYWLGNEYWGKGIATEALRQLLRLVTVRPLYGRAAKDNVASIRVLEKCGFAHVGEDRAFANGRGAEIEEVILVLRGENDQSRGCL
jgi:RimJ/RimL family protein N-acetyltransferase